MRGIQVDAGPKIPVWSLHAALVVPILVFVWAMPANVAGYIAFLAYAIGVAVPRSLATWVGVALTAVAILLTEPSPGTTAIALLLCHFSVVVATLIGDRPLSGWITVSALQPTAIRFGVIQVVAQLLALLAMFATGLIDTARLPWLAIGGGVAVLALALTLLIVRQVAASARRNSAD